MSVLQLVLVLLLLGNLTACGQPSGDASRDYSPRALDTDAIGYYCRMGLAEHSGPQAQMFVAGAEDPIWFSQVRDAVVYLRSPEETRVAEMVYVNDMSVAPSWDDPGEDNWIALGSAFLVIGSDRKGGMGAPEVIPFGNRSAANEFVREHGGRLVSLEEIPDSYVLSPMAM